MSLGGLFLATVCLVLQVIVFIFVVVAIPVDAFRSKHNSPITGHRTCYSLWGAKRCGNHDVNPDNLPNKGFPCARVMHTMTASAAFGFVSIFTSLVCIVLCSMLLCRRIGNVAVAICCFVCSATVLVSWACQAGAFHVTCAETGRRLSQDYRYNSSFSLLLTAWCLQMINVTMMFMV